MIAIFDCHLSHKQCSNSCDSDKSTDVCAPADVFIMDDAKKRQDEHRSRGHDGCGDPDARVLDGDDASDHSKKRTKESPEERQEKRLTLIHEYLQRILELPQQHSGGKKHEQGRKHAEHCCNEPVHIPFTERQLREHESAPLPRGGEKRKHESSAGNL